VVDIVFLGRATGIFDPQRQRRAKKKKGVGGGAVEASEDHSDVLYTYP